MKVLLDYGHGGSDPGAVSGNTYEKTLNLSIGLMTAKHLRRSGLEVIEPRVSDKFLDLSYRTSMGNSNMCNCLVSIHCNSSTNPLANGFEVITYGTGSNEIALAKCVETEFKKLKINNRGIKQGNLHMVREFMNPAVIVECGFLSNTSDLNFIHNSQNEIAISIATGICNFLGVKYIGEVNTSVVKYKVQVGAFNSKSNAESLRNELRVKGYPAIVVEV